MIARPEVAVTLSPELFDRLNTEAKRLGLAVEWLVAALVADTIEAGAPEPALT
jgi:hypothetical protein